MKYKNSSRMKLLYIMKYFAEFTDEEHPANACDVINYLAQYDIPIERKSVYYTVRLLNEFGVTIRSRSRKFYYVTKESDILHVFANSKL